MASKTEFISSITTRLGRPKPEHVNPPGFGDHPADGLYDNFSQKDFVEQFVREVEALSGNVMRIHSTGELEKAIHTFLDTGNVETVVVWDDDTGRGSAIKNACDSYTKKKSNTRVVVWKDDGNRDDLLMVTERSDAGIVYAEYGISETGTVVLYNRGGKGRAVSLLPNNIGIVLYTKDILPRITQVLERLSGPAAEHSCINFISGPSRSADIEMSLSIGVHGPGKITVFLVEE